MKMRIIRWGWGEGSATRPMEQPQALSYLRNILGAGSNRLTSLGQALTQAFNGGGKASGHLEYQGNATLHASAGRIGVQSVTLFYYYNATEDVLYVFAMGEHINSNTYELSDFHPPPGPDSDYGHRTIQLGH